MQLKLIDLLRSIRWAKNGDLTDFPQTNYEAGWAHLGDDTPTVQDFNYVQAMNDQKDQWLFAQINEVLKAQGIEATEDDLPALKRAIENLVTAKSTPKTITSTTKNAFDDSGHSHEIDQATTTQAGIVQLNSATNSTSETEAATPKAVKTLKDLLDSVSRNQANYIPNSKKSSSLSSPSSDTVATSVAVKTAYDKGVEAKNAADNANNNANGRVSKAGDEMTGDLTVPYLKVIRDNAWMNITSRNDAGSGIDLSVWGSGHAQSSMHCRDIGGYATELRFFNTPNGEHYATDRRQHVMTINPYGAIWTKPYGWLHDFFVKKERFFTRFYEGHYGGSQVFRIPMNDSGGLLITTTIVDSGGEQDFYTPEAYTGAAHGMVSDIGAGRYSFGIYHIGGNHFKLYGRGHTNINVWTMGWATF